MTLEASLDPGGGGGGGEGDDGGGAAEEEYSGLYVITNTSSSSSSSDVPWRALLLHCVLRVSQDLNISADLPFSFLALAEDDASISVEELVATRFNFSSPTATATSTTHRWNESSSSSVWEGEGGMQLAQCLDRNSPADRPYLLPWWQQLTWTLAFGSMLVVAVGGNAVVMWIVIAHRRMRTVTNYFLVNLSAADLLMAVFNCIFNFIYMLHSDWPFGSIYCTLSNFMANVTIAASVFTLMAISFDRYIAIVRPLKPRMTKSEARHFIMVIWVSSMTLAIPCLLYSTTVSIRYKNDEIRRGCFLLWPDGETSISYREYVYNIVFFATTYVLPMLVMLVSYSLIGCELWGSHSIGELTDRQISSINSKRRVVRMFIVIVVVFMLCWLPQQGFFLYQYHNSEVLDSASIQHIYLGFYWLAMANAMINPIIYYWMNARFRSYFREVVIQCATGRCCCCLPSSASSYLDSPHLGRRRQDSLDHTSRTRSALPNSRYSAKKKPLQVDSFFIRDLNYARPTEEGQNNNHNNHHHHPQYHHNNRHHHHHHHHLHHRSPPPPPPSPPPLKPIDNKTWQRSQFPQQGRGGGSGGGGGGGGGDLSSNPRQQQQQQQEQQQQQHTTDSSSITTTARNLNGVMSRGEGYAPEREKRESEEEGKRIPQSDQGTNGGGGDGGGGGGGGGVLVTTTVTTTPLLSSTEEVFRSPSADGPVPFGNGNTPVPSLVGNAILLSKRKERPTEGDDIEMTIFNRGRKNTSPSTSPSAETNRKNLNVNSIGNREMQEGGSAEALVVCCSPEHTAGSQYQKSGARVKGTVDNAAAVSKEDFPALNRSSTTSAHSVHEAIEAVLSQSCASNPLSRVNQISSCTTTSSSPGGFSKIQKGSLVNIPQEIML